jgi:hypothetical protein
VQRPLVSFIAIGLALFVADRALLRAGQDASPVVVTRERVDELRATIRAQTGREPGDAELAARIRAEVDDELLIREARSRGFDRDDPVIFRRLVQNMRFAGAADDRSDASLFEEAVDLGMHLSDPVVRRRLVQRMRLMAETLGAEAEPGDEEIRRRYERDWEEYVRPERVRITHLYFAGDREEEATRLLDRLVTEGALPGAPDAVGDAFLLSADQPLQTRRALGDRFGADFADGVFALPQGIWSGPLRSSYGLHLVWVHERVAAVPLPLEAVRDRVRYGLLAERRAESLERLLAALRARTDVVVAGEVWRDAG